MHETSEPRPAVDLALVLHFHQPVGNFDEVFRRVIDQCYRPLLEMLHRHERVNTHLHLNGILLDWFDRNAPDLMELMVDMCRRGSTEMLGGGHQEPILTVLPDADAVGQIRALSDELERRFGQRPKGLWLTERVWEPRLPSPLHRAGIRYTVLDDAIFRWAGVEEEGLLGYWMTEDCGHPLAIFPGHKSLRYTIPFRPHDETFDLLRGLSRPDGRRPLMVYADDAEKFGEWPGTYEWVFEKGWLETFLSRLGKTDWIRTVHLGRSLEQELPEGRVYPPTASYPEMTVWALPTPARRRIEELEKTLEEDDPLELAEFVRGGHWRGFLGKYPEVDRLHKRMLRVSNRLHALSASGDAPRLEAARRDLYRGQCNDAYWHGSFGGVYLVHLRRALETHLIRAARSLDAMEHGDGEWIHVASLDLDADGREELELRSPHAALVIDPDAGGAVVAWDLMAACENLVTVLSRHEEAFHAALLQPREASPAAGEVDSDGIANIHGDIKVKEGVSVDDLKLDAHDRVAFVEWYASADAPVDDPDAFARQARRLHGSWKVDEASDQGSATLLFDDQACKLSKTLALGSGDSSVSARYAVESNADSPPWRLGSEWNLMVGYTGEDLEVESPHGWQSAPNGCREEVSSLRFRGGGGRELSMECSPAATVSWMVVHTVSSSEGGLEKNGQGTAFLVSWPVDGRLDASLHLHPMAPALADEPLS